MPASPQTWCALCSAYTDHDTVHHSSQGAPVVSDMITIEHEGRTYEAKVEETRGRRMRVSFPLSRGRTHTIWVDLPTNGRS